MVQFTLGCILIAMTLFFGGKDILANHKMLDNRERSLKSEESKIARATSIKQRYEAVKENTLIYSAEAKSTLLNQLNIDENKYKFDLKEPEKTDKVLSIYEFDITGFDDFSNIYALVSDIEKIKGLDLLDVCFNCEVKDENLVRQQEEIGFNVKGKAYVYNEEK
ncbi:MAG TPA: hypothetical protein DCL21_02005 [Alphaproteobacteria bacterium]|nr:hypothetical protein [Alphaproteobacteria bacterium]